MAKKLAIIGLGRAADAYINGINRLNQTQREKQIHVSHVCDSYPGRAGEWVQKHFASIHFSVRPVIFTDWRSLLSETNRPDLVTILLPQHLHLEVAREFLSRGIAVQMQKPLGLGIRDSRELIAIAEEKKTPLVVCEPSILGRGTRLQLDWLHSGKQLGRPTLMIDQSVVDVRGGYMGTPWRHIKGMAGAGWMMDHGLSRVHWMLEAFGLCTSVYAQARQVDSHRQDERWGRIAVDTEDLAAATLNFKSGVVVPLTAMSSARGNPHRHVQVWGTEGTLLKDRVTLAGEVEPRELALNPEAVGLDVPADPYAHSYYELLQRMKDAEWPVVGTPHFAMEAQAIVYACMESALTQQVVSVDDILTGRAGQYEQTVWSAYREALKMDMNALT